MSKKGGGKGGGVAIGVGALAMAVIAVLTLFRSCGGLGFGDKDGSGDAGQETTTEEKQEITEEELKSLETITITISEDVVYVENKEIDNKDDLEDLLENINTDGKLYIIKQEHPIQYTYDWTMEVLGHLELDYKEEKN